MNLTNIIKIIILIIVGVGVFLIAAKGMSTVPPTQPPTYFHPLNYT